MTRRLVSGSLFVGLADRNARGHPDDPPALLAEREVPIFSTDARWSGKFRREIGGWLRPEQVGWIKLRFSDKAFILAAGVMSRSSR